MSNLVNLSDTAANAAGNALGALLNSGTLQFFAGTQPANANTALSGNTHLATLTFGNPAFGAAAGGVLTANAITGGTAVNSGTATFARLYESDGMTVVCDMVVATSGGAITLNTTALVAGTPVALTSLTITVNEL